MYVLHPEHSPLHYKDQSYKCTYTFLSSACYFNPILTRTRKRLQILVKITNIKFHENSPNASRIVPRGQMYRWSNTTRLTAYSLCQYA